MERQVTVNDIAPAAPNVNDIWIRTTNWVTKRWSGTAWVDVYMTLEASLGTDHTYNGMTIVGTAGENVVFGDLVYRKTADGKWWKTDADFDALTRPMLAMVTETINANDSGTLLIIGFIRDDDWTLTDGEPVFVSVTLGAISSTAPVAVGDFVRKIGFACSSTQHILYFNPDATVLELV